MTCEPQRTPSLIKAILNNCGRRLPPAWYGALAMTHTKIFCISAVLFFATPSCGEDDPKPVNPCGFDPPTIAGTPATDALASSPARCGQPAHEWIDSPNLGEIVGVDFDDIYPQDTLMLAAMIAGIELPEDPVYDVRVQQVLYTTQDRGQLVEASALIATPQGVDKTTELDVLLVLHPTMGFNDDCAPSNDSDIRAMAAIFASLGFVVVAPDFLGLKGTGVPTGFVHPYIVGQPTAIASLDAVRAAGRLTADVAPDLCVRPRALVFGGSQGGHALLWVDRLAAYYAPELEMLGMAATVPASDLAGHVMRATKEVVESTPLAAAFLGAAADWYGAADVNELFKLDLDPTVPELLASECNPDLRPDNLEELFAASTILAAAEDTLLDLEPWGCIIKENGLTTTSIPRVANDSDSYGILYVLGENDSLAYTPIEQQAFDILCDQGMPLEYLECAGANHGQTTEYAMIELFNFLMDRQAGKPMRASTCTRAEPVICLSTP
ncbi:MAG: hypothetical protein A2289_26615 [Deltaproteobacteria bacterium RIFOXYA12_FULL_58_15]|nr:MAG: hypothetical protein A2289_26615 [Deltaproteobacteria bacterium RIFOXYA12_FULL_58_15]OGR14088.1 MAG: hypothetical protein A2341_14615 [Deltaproteobacteria bacterium RIFOXYB12_FULL_58_9]